MKRAVVAGHICLDIIPHIDHSFDLVPGRLYEVGAPTIATGGAVSNTGVALHKLGIPTVLMGKIGDDSFGHSIQDVLRSHGASLADGMVMVPEAVSSYTVVVNIPGTDRMFLHCPGANNSFCSGDVDMEALRGASMFHFGYPAFMAATYAERGAELVRMYRQVKRAGLTTSLDLGMPDPGGPGGQADWRAILGDVLPTVDIFMPSADELLYVLDRSRFGQGDGLGAEDLSRLSRRLLDMGTAIAAIKLGARGMYIRTAGAERLADLGPGAPADVAEWAQREAWFPIFREERMAGTTGAGDTAIAGFLAALLRGLPFAEAGRFANAVGACNVEQPDALSGIRGWDETLARIGAGWETVRFAVGRPGWREGDRGTWFGPEDSSVR
ncbi:MAG: carbohydrate kinase family protein [Lentisphaeria bacterium]|nr:carbohydrate kinase family protein [Lentisphaeria bacterium]